MARKLTVCYLCKTKENLRWVMICNHTVCMGSKDDYRQGQLDVLESVHAIAQAALAASPQPVVDEVRYAMDYHNLGSDIPKGAKRVLLVSLPDSINEGDRVRIVVWKEAHDV